MKSVALAVIAMAVGIWFAIAGMVVGAPTAPPAPPAKVHASLFDALPRYDSEKEAAVAAAARLYACSHYYECADTIVTDSHGKYLIGPTLVSDSASDHVRIGHNAPMEFKLVADIHSHPCLDETHEVRYFSPDDIEGALSERLTAYMLDECTGEVHVFVPGKDSPNNDELTKEPGIFLTKGRVIGKVPVTGLSVEPNHHA